MGLTTPMSDEPGRRIVQVRESMTREVLTIGPEAPIKDVAKVLIENGISGLPVCDIQNRVLGIRRHITGSGAEVGDVIVDHPKTRYVAFTGSKEVGLRINERAAKVHEGQLWIKRVVAEMGGKDAIIVAGDADLDEAATGVVQSAFGFQGQKCSACSRAIIDASVYDRMLDKIVERTAKIKLADPSDHRQT